MLPNDLMKHKCFNSTEDSTFFRKCQQAAEKVPASLGFGILTWVLSEFPLKRNVLIERKTRELLELSAQVILADIEPGSQPVEGQIFREVFIDVKQDLIHFLIFCHVIFNRIRCIVIRAADLHQKFCHIGTDKRAASQLFAVFCLRHPGADPL